jgi:hypothetical protein
MRHYEPRFWEPNFSEILDPDPSECCDTGAEKKKKWVESGRSVDPNPDLIRNPDSGRSFPKRGKEEIHVLKSSTGFSRSLDVLFEA